MSGLKPVRHRRDDALARIGWERFEALLATYYRDAGYSVEHCGTGATRRRTDGGIDLRLRRGEEFILVQCKHWNAYQVPHNDVHQLLGLLVNEGATGAVLVTSGEFTEAAREAAARLGHVQLIDGEQLREMLGPLPESTHSLSERFELSAPVRRFGRPATAVAGRSERTRRSHAMRSLASSPTLRVVVAGLFLLMVWFAYRYLAASMASLASQRASEAQVPGTPSAPPIQPQALPSTGPLADAAKTACRPAIDAASGTYADQCADPQPAPTAAELRELQRKADEAAKVLEESTPEM